MKKLFSLLPLFLLLLTGHSIAQYSYQDINSQLTGKAIGAIASDNNGNVIVSGNFATTITFGSYTLVSTEPTTGTGSAGFVAQLSPNGSFSWAKCINVKSSGNTSSQVDIVKVVTDAGGNIYIAGGFIGIIKMDNISLTSAKGTWDLFTVKMSSSGVFLWAKSEGASDDVLGCTGEEGYSVTTDSQGNVYTTGDLIGKVFKNTSICGCGSTKPVHAIYVVKYNSSGTKLWEKKYLNSLETASTPCGYNPTGKDIKDDGTNVYVTGTIYGSVTFGSTTLNTAGNTTGNSFLLKLDGNGNTLWARSVTNGDNKGLDILLDNNNTDVYLNGRFSIGTINFGGPSLTTGMNNTQYIGKYSSAGNCSWAVIAGGAIGALRHHSFKHPNGNLAAIVGGFIYPFPPFTYKEFSTLDGAIVDSTVASVYTTATDVVSLPGGFVYAQNLKDSYDFGGITISSTQPSTSNYSDMILVKYGSAPPAMAHPVNGTSNFTPSGITLYPNPATYQITIANSPDKILGTVTIMDITGKIIFQKKYTYSEAKIDVQDFVPGMYYIRTDNADIIKFLKQ